MPRRREKFYNFSFDEKNNTTDFYLYGEIINGGNDWKFDETDVTFQDVRDTLDGMEDNSTLNIYINSPGGSVFTTQGIIAMLERAKDRGITINSYIDGIGASCASWLPMIADNLYIYSGSILMIHKPMSCVSGNADEMREQIEILDKIENETIIPLYMSRVKEGITEDDIRDYMAKETWFTSNEILNIFDNITLLENKKEIACCVDRDVMKNYVNIPDNIKDLLEKEGNNLNEDIKNKEELENEEVEETTEANEESVEEQVEEQDGDVDTEEVTESSNEEQDGQEEQEPSEQEPSEQEPSQEEEPGEEDPIEQDVEEEEENLQKKLNVANEKVITLNDKVQELENKVKELEVIANKYNAIQEEKAKKELANKIEEKANFYKNKFEKVGALDKFESDEVQNLIKDCVSNNESLSKLNEMLVDMICVENNEKVVNTNISEVGTNLENLIPTEETSLSSLFE